MAQQETYGNWLGPAPAKRLVRQPGIYSVAEKMSSMGDFRPASPDSFDDDYDDVSMPGSDRGCQEPPSKGVYLLAGPPGSSQTPSLKDLEEQNPNSRDLNPNSRDLNPNSRDLDPKSQEFAPKFGGRCQVLVATLALLVALSALGWAGLLSVAMGREKEIKAELELLKSNFSEIWDSVRQDQTRLQFGTHQQQLELQELSDLLCRTLGGSRRCRAGWKSHGRSCYSFSEDSLSWDGASSACADLGAHLVVVNDEEEQAFLLEHSERSSSYWLGVTERGGKWSWIRGENPKFGFWDVWVKDPQKELKDCGALGPKGRWVGEFCSLPLRWICEKSWQC